MSKRRTFSAEFKRGAVEQASQPGVSCAQVARELGIRDALLARLTQQKASLLFAWLVLGLVQKLIRPVRLLVLADTQPPSWLRQG